MTDEELHRSLLAEFADAGVTGGSLFGWRAFKLDGSSLGCIKNGIAAFRLGADNPALAAALQLPGAAHFDPGRKNRPFSGWIELPATDRDILAHLLASAIEANRP